MKQFIHFLAIASLTLAIYCAIMAVVEVFDHNWLKAAYYVAMTGINHFSYNNMKRVITNDNAHGSSNDKRDNAE